ncbi:hypothetical protein VV869_23825 [Photobacterium sp. MCCC 1A19761]|uniref:hypothetical protein n=1 Tax=Photobacterium sp. MCCC 1A19761 TaxID=3115000 RepID=UPI00307F716B
MSAQIADFNLRFNAETVQFEKDVNSVKKMLRGYARDANAANDATGGFNKQINAADISLKRLNGVATLAAGSIGAVTAGLGAAATASTFMVRHTAQQAREIERMATVAQVSVEEIQALGYASEQYSISGDKMADILKDVNDKIGDFTENEGGEFADFMANIAPLTGLTIEKLQELSGPEALIAVKNAMDATNVPMKSQLHYLEAIANDASALMPLLENKGARLYQLTRHYNDLNVAMSEYDIGQFKAMDQQIGDMEKQMGRAFRGLARQVTYALLPTMSDVNGYVTDLSKGVNDYTQQIKAMGVASATWSVLSGNTMREKHRELFAEIVELKAELAEYENIPYDSLMSINLLPGGKSQNALNNIQRDLAMKQDALKRINETVIEQQKMVSGWYDSPLPGSSAGTGDDGGLNQPVRLKQTDKDEQKSGQTRLASLDTQYADERTKLQLAHEQRLSDIEDLQLSEAEIKRRGFESMAALRQEYQGRENEFYQQQQEDYQTQQDQRIQAELEAFARKEEEKTQIAEREAKQREAIEQRIDQQVLAMKYNLASQTLGLIADTAKEGSFIQKAAFVAQKAMAAMQVFQQGEVAAMAALSPPPIGLGPTAGQGYATTIRAMAGVSAGMILGQSLAGMAHSGIEAVPAEGTWLLDKGERVYTNDSARRIDQMYGVLMAMSSSRFAVNDPVYQQQPQAAAPNIFKFENQFNTSGGQAGEDVAQLAQMVNSLVVQVLEREIRPGGMLSGLG